MSDYSLLDFGTGQRLEQWGPYRLSRPDPSAENAPALSKEEWEKADAVYEGAAGKGQWKVENGKLKVDEQWIVEVGGLKFQIKLTPYKHTGLFPEQEFHWNWMRAIGMKRPLKILNLFGYTGGSTIALANDGHHVTHVDTSRPALTWANENRALNNLLETAVRWMPEDAIKFVKRELKRGNFYDAIVMDPPAVGHSEEADTWRLERDLEPLVQDCVKLLSKDPAFFLINSYARQNKPSWIQGLMHYSLKERFEPVGRIEAGDLFLEDQSGRKLSTGVYARWQPRG